MAIFRDGEKYPVIETLYEHLPQPFIDDDGTTKYVGYAAIGISPATVGWRIEKHVTTGSVTTVEYPRGSMNFDFVWDDRATYDYTR